MGRLVPKRHTPWATPMIHHEVVVNMDSILRVAGIEEDYVRRRLTAHAIHASGWRQHCDNFNVWKVKLAKSDWDWYVESTLEEKEGVDVPEKGTRWRAYPSYVAALEDHPVFSMSRYSAAKAALIDGSRPDGDFFEELGNARYWTDTHARRPYFEGICRRVRRELAAASPEEMAAADEATAIAANLEAGADNTRPFPLVAVLAACAVGIGVVLCGIGVARMMRGRK